MAIQKILEVQAVKLLVSGKSCILTIVASGTVPTSGWSNPQLIPYVYIMPPQEGVYNATTN